MLGYEGMAQDEALIFLWTWIIFFSSDEDQNPYSWHDTDPDRGSRIRADRDPDPGPLTESSVN